jgi:hypothetical protein
VENISESLSAIGGARLDNFNASYPFATLSADRDAIHLTCLGKHYDFPRAKIQKLSRHRGIFSVGLRIQHNDNALPAFVVFWASAFFWSSGFSNLKQRLENLGYSIAD